MAKIYDSVEIGLTMPELRQALSCWMSSKTSIFDYRVTDVSLHPSGKCVVRFTVEPPMTKAAQAEVTTDLPETVNT